MQQIGKTINACQRIRMLLSQHPCSYCGEIWGARSHVRILRLRIWLLLFPVRNFVCNHVTSLLCWAPAQLLDRWPSYSWFIGSRGRVAIVWSVVNRAGLRRWRWRWLSLCHVCILPSVFVLALVALGRACILCFIRIRIWTARDGPQQWPVYPFPSLCGTPSNSSAATLYRRRRLPCSCLWSEGI